MTEQSTQENQVTEEENKFNRQVNYLIMRYMWQQYHRKGTNNTETIYDVFNTSRERYTRIINTGVVRYKKNGRRDLPLYYPPERKPEKASNINGF